MALNGPFRNLIGALKQTSKQGLDGVFTNSALAMAAVFTIVLWTSIILAYFQQTVGVSTGSLPPTDPLLEFIELSIAPIREELGFRVIPIGIAAFLIILSKRRVRDSILSLWHPSKYLKKVDSPDEYKRHLNIIYVMIALARFSLEWLTMYLVPDGVLERLLKLRSQESPWLRSTTNTDSLLQYSCTGLSTTLSPSFDFSPALSDAGGAIHPVYWSSGGAVVHCIDNIAN